MTESEQAKTDRGSGAPSLVDKASVAFTAYQAGDRQRMGELVDLLTPLLWHTARGQGLSGHRAEDVVQTAWLRLVEHAEGITTPKAVVAWLITTVRRESWRTGRAAGRENGDLDDVPEAMSPEPSPEDAAILHDRQVILWRHMAGLNERCQHLLRVVAFAERPDYATIAETLGMPVGSIGPTRGRCLSALRKSLEQDPHWDGGM